MVQQQQQHLPVQVAVEVGQWLALQQCRRA
jgi:hypothetical protein